MANLQKLIFCKERWDEISSSINILFAVDLREKLLTLMNKEITCGLKDWIRVCSYFLTLSSSHSCGVQAFI